MKKVPIITVLAILGGLLLVGAIVLLIIQLTAPESDPLLDTIDPQITVTLNRYSSSDPLAVEVEIGQITDVVVESELLRLRQEQADTMTVTDGAKQGDTVIITYTGIINGEEFFSDQGHTFIIGGNTNQFPINGLDQHLLGVKAGDTITPQLIIQDDYFVADMAGKTVSFTITVDQVERVNLPPLDTAFAKTQGCNTVDELRTLVRERLEIIQQAANETAIREEVWQQAKKDAVFDEATLDTKAKAKADEIIANLRSIAQQEGFDLLGYAYFNMGYEAEDETELIEMVIQGSKEELREDAFLVAFCKQENILLENEKYQELVNRDVKINQDAGFPDYTKENLIEDYDLADETALKLYYLRELAIDRLMETAQVTTTLAK